MKRLRKWLSDFWHWHGWQRCASCRRWFRCHAFWNPKPYDGKHLCCSMECCAAEEGRPVAELEAELPDARRTP